MRFIRGVSENAVGNLVCLALLAAAAWGISKVDAPVALWIVFLVFLLGTVAGLKIGRMPRFGGNLFAYQSDLIGEAMQGLREVIAGKLNVSFEDFIERGVLAPARFALSTKRGEEIRISVLQPNSDGQTFRMTFESGHSLGRKDNFSLSMTSLAGHALRTGELQWSNDIETDNRWHRHPRASEARSYRSLACIPVVVGDDPVAILSVVSSAKGDS
jgi:GAF domain-containing protein